MNPFQKFHGKANGFRLWHVAHTHWPKGQIFQYSQMRKQIELLKDHSDILADHIHGFSAAIYFGVCYLDRAGFMNFQSVDTADQCRFSRTRRPADDNDIAGIDIQTHRVEGLKITKVFRQSVNMDQRSGFTSHNRYLIQQEPPSFGIGGSRHPMQNNSDRHSLLQFPLGLEIFKEAA